MDSQAVRKTNAIIISLSNALSFNENQGRHVMIRYRIFDQIEILQLN